MTRVRTAFLVLLTLSFAPRPAQACSCDRTGPPCEAAWKADALFVGTVRSVERLDTWGETRVTFVVEKGFINAPVSPLDVFSNAGGAACGIPFSRGDTYLVYAYRDTIGRLTTGRCTRTRPVAEAADDLRYLDPLPTVGAGARIFGVVRQWQRRSLEAREVDEGPIAGVTVSVTGGHYFRETLTDRHGRYEFRSLPTGSALLVVAAGERFYQPWLKRHLELPDPRSCAEQDFRLHESSAAWGRVVDAAGRPVRGAAVDAVDVALAGQLPAPYQFPARTGDDGVFVFEDLPPGRYVFSVDLARRHGTPPTGSAVFLAGTTDRREAKMIELAAGDRTDVGTIRLP